MDDLSEANDPLLKHSKKTPSSSAYVIAVFSIIVIVTIWVLISELLQELEYNYKKPILLSFLTHSFYCILLPIWGIFEGKRQSQEIKNKSRLLLASETESTVSTHEQIQLIPKIMLYWKGAFILGIEYTLEYVFWYISLQTTLASANNCIFQSSCAFVYLLSVPILGERLQVRSTVSVLISLFGVLLIALYSSGDDKESTTLGYLFCILATILYSLYEVLVKKYGSQSECIKEQLCDSTLFLGLTGVSNLIVLFPLLIIAHYTGLEVFDPPTNHQIKLIILNVFLDLTCNLCILFAITLTGPLFFSVGSMLIIPATISTDVFFKNLKLSAGMLFGSFLVISGFILLHAEELTFSPKKKSSITPRL